ncbi:MAG: head fiber protein [Candidatus Cloacimonetes bacterium]|nr:hypothetical protein [Candidatus Cloacimonadota bacterium]MCK9332287.1 head fiber protein [Candidatus Cloacimonadota bacterium]
MSYNVKNYTEQGGEKTVINGEIVINGKITVSENAEVEGVGSGSCTLNPATSTSIGGVKEALNVKESSAANVGTLKNDLNELIANLKDAGVIAKDLFEATVAAITNVNGDLATNHSKIESIVLNEGTVTIKVPVDELIPFDSNNPAQGIHKWIGLSIGTGLTSILGVIYNGTYALAAADVTEATNVGCPAGSFVLWIKCDEVVDTPKVITLGKPGFKTETLTIVIED